MANCITVNMTSDVCPHVVTKNNHDFDVINVTIDKTPAEIYESVQNDVPVIVTGLFPVGIAEDGSAKLIKVTTYVSDVYDTSFSINYDNWFDYGVVPVSPPTGDLHFNQGPSNNSVLEIVYMRN